MYNFRRAIFSTILVFNITTLCNTAHAARAIVNEDRKSEIYWKTDKAKLLDSIAMLNALKARMGKQKSDNAKPTPKQGDVAAQILQLILSEQSGKQGVHIETALTTLGAMAGFSCQMAIRDGFVATGKITLDKAFVTVKTKGGETFYTGPFLNECLVTNNKGQHSVWGFVGAPAQQLNKPLPDLKKIFSHTSATIGADNYGIADLPKRHLPKKSSEELLWKYWNICRNTLVANEQPPMFWPFVLGTATQQLILQAKGVIDPTLASKIVMEAAIPMSKIDPKRIHASSLIGLP